MLDLWQNDQSIADQDAVRNSAPDLPSTFGEGFDAAWNEGRLFSQSVAGENARMDALQDHIDTIKGATGKDVGQSIDWSQFSAPGVGMVPPTASMLLPQVNDAAQKLGQPTLSDDDLQQRAVEKSRAAQSAYAAFDAREKGSGAGLGEFLGGAVGAALGLFVNGRPPAAVPLPMQ